MPVGLTFSINLNDLFKEILAKFKDAYDRGDDLQAIEKDCRRQINRFQNLQTFLENEDLMKGTAFANMSEAQRGALLDQIRDAEDHWQKFNRVMEKQRTSPKWFGKATTPARYIARDKAKLEVALARIERVNKDIKDEVDTFIAWFTNSTPSAVPKLENDASAQAAGLSRNVTLRRTWRNTMIFDKALLQKAALIKPPSVGTQEAPEPLLRKAIYAQTTNVLVEHRYHTSHDGKLEYDALQLATFLALEKPTTMKVLPCIATYHHEQSRSYGFVFDIKPLAPDNPIVADNSRTSLGSALPTFTSLRKELLKTAENPLFRYSKFGSDLSFSDSPAKYLSLSERLRFASSLANTVYEVLLVDWVHQDIRSDNIWFTIDHRTSLALSGLNQSIRERIPGTPYLFNFEFARPSDKYSNPHLIHRNHLSTNLTRHPSRQYGSFLVPHHKIHDIYALGIVLLEIGLGRPIGDLYAFFKSISLADPNSLAIGTLPHQPVQQEAEARRHRIIVGAAAMLPERMGDRYAAIVDHCLRGDLSQQEDAGENANMEDIGLIGTFRSIVVKELDHISRELATLA